MASAECSDSIVVDSIDKFLMNLSMVIWWMGVICLRSLRTAIASVSKGQGCGNRKRKVERNVEKPYSLIPVDRQRLPSRSFLLGKIDRRY